MLAVIKIKSRVIILIRSLRINKSHLKSNKRNKKVNGHNKTIKAKIIIKMKAKEVLTLNKFPLNQTEIINNIFKQKIRILVHRLA